MEERMHKQCGLYPPSLPFERENVCSRRTLVPVGPTAYVSAVNIFWSFICIYSVFIRAFLWNACKFVR